MENSNSNRAKLIISILGLALLGVALFFLLTQENKEDPFVEPILEEETEIIDNTNTPEDNSASPEVVEEPAGALTTPEYKALLQKGHDFYLKGEYESALEIFNQALKIEQNDRVYMSMFTTYLAMKNYPEAEKAIKYSIALNKRIPSNWLDYASFEAEYMNASFEVVSKVYLDGLAATGNNIDLLTNYATYLISVKKYDEAITYLEQAKVKDPKRASIFQAEIDRLKAL